jgi:hypothetical protein
MINGSKAYSNEIPLRPPLKDDFGIKEFDSGWVNSKDVVTDDILSTPEKYYAFVTSRLDIFNKAIKDRLGYEQNVEPRYFVSGTKGYARMVDKSYATCWDPNRNIHDKYDAMRDVQDYVRGMLLYTDKEALVKDINTLIEQGEKTGDVVVYGIKNRLKTPLAIILMKIRIQGVACELQFLYYENDKDVPVPGSK